MTNESGVQADPGFLALLPALEARLPTLERRELAEAMAPVVARLQEPIPADQRTAVAEAVRGLCRRLFAGARSADALPLARGRADNATSRLNEDWGVNRELGKDFIFLLPASHSVFPNTYSLLPASDH